MLESNKLNFLREEVAKATTREALDLVFKKWRESNLLPLRDQIKKANSSEEKKKLGLLLKGLQESAQLIYQEKKDSLSGWAQPFYGARDHLGCSGSVNYSSRNLLSELLQDVVDFIEKYSFEYLEDSEIVNISDNFDDLLIPETHPARATSDSFFLVSKDGKERKMLRTHTTTNTLKILKKFEGKSFRGASFGCTYRKEDNNATHLSQFHQLDLVWVDQHLTLEHLKELIEALISSLLGSSIEKKEYRFRSSYFPFTSPSYEVDLRCSCSADSDCRMCKGTNWIEILGCGFLRQEILNRTHKEGGQSALALGLGLERLCMIKHSLTDIRELYKNDLSKLVVKY
ncbi:phenylalanyl-tRNA ligase subunit alpha [Candidatus Mycoplasma haematolamae str. Purdue]|uniref:phenylalanine--tRNA ligase n=1 Tax=Mycoplasma haematolamae (strain Purdue) TaxID=1212765 RepID=I7CIF1_MYCHA|nr:hypothetical protein [Candidatus Mycoplasma haematolamae]AFO51629.1 phenylalanyl-tRNA ligase subunit alpha [Candidatus Mycoplasma haematolamae str. Purdue]